MLLIFHALGLLFVKFVNGLQPKPKFANGHALDFREREPVVDESCHVLSEASPQKSSKKSALLSSLVVSSDIA
jgi:hypothetical protein